MPSSFSDKSQPVGSDDASPKLCASATDLATSAFFEDAAPPLGAAPATRLPLA